MQLISKPLEWRQTKLKKWVLFARSAEQEVAWTPSCLQSTTIGDACWTCL